VVGGLVLAGVLIARTITSRRRALVAAEEKRRCSCLV
jgi:hypothetical protein